MSSSSVTLLFTDLVNRAELVPPGGDEQTQRTVRAHHRLLKRCAAAHGGQDVKWLGDGFVTTFGSPADAVRCAVALQQAARRRAVEERLTLRAGLHVGAALGDESNYFGAPVVVARRLCEHATAGQILCTTVVAGLVTGPQPFTVHDRGALPLGGGAAPVAVCEVAYHQDQPTALLMHTPFVGRAGELRRLDAKLQDVRAGHGGLVTLVGEAGIGKTRMLEEFAETARSAGALVLWGRCYDGDAARSYGPFVEALADYGRTAAPDALRADLGLGAAPLARLVPALAERLPDLPAPVALQPDEERVRLLDAMAQFVIALSARAPVVLVLDDLHWADAATVSLLRHVARFAARHRLLIVIAYREVEITPGHPVAPVLGVLPSETTYLNVPLAGLDTTEVDQLLETVADHKVAPTLVAAITAETSGNPFFIREVLLHLVEEGKVVSRDGQWTASFSIEQMGIPQGVRQVIQRRLARLSAAANRVLQAAAGCVGSFRLEVVARVAGLDEGDALDAIDDALAAQLVRPTNDADSFDFTHALVRHTLYGDLSPAAREQLHRKIADTMVSIAGGGADAHAAEIAQHFHRSASLAGAERGAAYAYVAADHAESKALFADAATYLQMALAMLPGEDPQRARTAARLGLVLTWSQAFDEAVRVAGEAGDLIAAAEGPGAAGDYLADAADALWRASFTSRAWTLAARGMRHAYDRRDLTRLRLMLHDRVRQLWEGAEDIGYPVECPDWRALPDLAASLPKVPERVRNQPGLAFVLYFTAWEDVRTRDHLLARVKNDPESLACWAGEYRQVHQLCMGHIEFLLQRGQLAAATLTLNFAARMQSALGDLEASTALRARAVALADRITISPWLALNMEALPLESAIVRGEDFEGLIAAAEHTAQEAAVEVKPVRALMRAFAAYGAACLGERERAMQRLAEVVPAIERAPGWMMNYTLLIHLASATVWELGCRDHADVFERNLRAKTMGPDFRYPQTDSRLSLARLCALQGRQDEAHEWFDQARAVLDEQGARPLRALVDFDEALMHVRCDTPGDRARAAPLVERALAQFRSIGMTGWARRAEAMAGALGAEPAAREHDISPADGPGHALPAARRETFCKHGAIWTLTYHGHTIRLPHVRGLADLQQLVLEPGRELHVETLDACDGERPSPDGGWTAEAPREARITVPVGRGDAGEMLDDRARRAYRARLREAQAELADAEECHDLGRITRLRAELEAVEHELRAAVGLGGRVRRAKSDSDRLRVAVTKRIRGAIAQLAAACPALGDHLTASIRTGIYCVYEPPHDQRVAWTASDDAPANPLDSSPLPSRRG